MRLVAANLKNRKWKPEILSLPQGMAELVKALKLSQFPFTNASVLLIALHWDKYNSWERIRNKPTIQLQSSSAQL